MPRAVDLAAVLRRMVVKRSRSSASRCDCVPGGGLQTDRSVTVLARSIPPDVEENRRERVRRAMND